MAFSQKNISAVITLGEASVAPVTTPAGLTTPSFTYPNSFDGQSGANTVTLKGYRMSAKIVKAGGASQGELQMRIYGLSLPLMNQLSTLGRTPVQINAKNTISVSAWEGDATPTVAFLGTIYQGRIDLSNAPDGIFHVTAYAGLAQAVQTIPPSSYPGAVDVADIMKSLASQMGLDFEGNGVSVILPASYYPGSAKAQMDAAARDANINAYIDNGKLAIWTKGGSRAITSIPLISPDTGMKGYPYPSGQGLLGVETLFNNGVVFGGQIQVKSAITSAVGAWTVCHIDHDIESQLPGGNWKTTLLGQPPGYLTGSTT